MFGKNIAGVVIMLVCSWGCAALFYFIGRFADKNQKPIHFWAGTQIDPRHVSDIAAYNHESAVMWKLYSIPYWLAGFLSCFGVVSDAFTIAGASVLFIACFPGLWFLIQKYRKIEKTYICR